MQRLGIICVASVLSVAVTLGTDAAELGGIASEIEKLNVQIDGLKSEAERLEERRLVKNFVSPLFRKDYPIAHQLAEQYAFQSSSPELRAGWRAIGVRIDEYLAAKKAKTAKAVDSVVTQLPAAWEIQDPAKLDPLRTELAALLRNPESNQDDRISLASVAIANWQSVLQDIQNRDFLQATERLDELDGSLVIPKEKLSSARESIYQTSQDLSADFRKESLNLIEASRSRAELKAAVDKIASRDIAQFSIAGTTAHAEAHATWRFAGILQRSLLALEKSHYSYAINEVEQAQQLDAGDELTEAATRMRDDIKKEMEAAVSAYVSKIRERLQQAESLADYEQAMEWLRQQQPVMADSQTPGADYMKAAYEVAIQWHIVMREFRERHYQAALQSMKLLEHNNADVLPAEIVAELRAMVLATSEKEMKEYIEESRRRIVDSKDAESAIAAVGWITSHPTLKGIAPDSTDALRADRLKYMATTWQDHLVARSRGDLVKSRATMTDLQKSLVRHDRAWFRETVEQAGKQLAELEIQSWRFHMEKIGKAVQVADANGDFTLLMGVLQAARNEKGGSRKIHAEIIAFLEDASELRTLQRMVKQNGVVYARSRIKQLGKLKPHRWSKWVDRYELKILLPEIAAIGQIKELKPKGDLALGPLLLSAADEAVAAEDWEQVLGILETYYDFRVAPARQPKWLSQEIAGAQGFVVAQRLEATGDLAGAKRQYETIIRYVAARVPRKQAQERLAELRKKHPNLF